MVKDTIDVQGWPTRCGSRALADAAPAARDADVVAALRTAGWRITGKTKLHELAFGTTGLNAHDGTPLNPRWPALVPGGSSSGSAAAVAAGLVPMALGTDTGGSVRVPAACCGVLGLKPSFGLVSRRGVAPAASSLDCVGPIAADMPTLIAAMRAIAPGFELPALPATIRVGVLKVDAAAEIVQAVHGALDAWPGVQLQAVESPLFGAAYDAGLAIINRETWAACAALVETGRVGADVEARLCKAALTTPDQVAAAEQVRSAFSAQIDALLERCDVLALPTLAEFPPRLEDAADTAAAVAMTRLVRPFNLSGHPAISLPLPAAARGPIALQLVAARGADGLLCAIAQAFSEGDH
ncbi:amidase [Paucibacter sp. R3-3]|uniref:Amidase n=1 Tax=Roseateles agri TaxID=3098619 RepID=A0ABU5DGH3_9BURK|nr:amidase [Paucibacter sp. R3-3]MDY0745239.1 amidase [Paucibacter sp. R3-3]